MFSLQDISKRFGEFAAVAGVSLEINDGESLVLAGESGSGKTTLCRIAAGMEKADTGQVVLDGKILAPSCRKRSFSDCASIQYIFQDPYHALEPGFTVRKTLRECARICERYRREAMPMEDALAYVDRRLLEYLDRPVRELSGGQRQKVCIARALMPNPRVIIADESTSMLDKRSGTEVFDLLHRIKEEKNMILLAILHDVDFSYTKWERIAVMYQGLLVEQAAFAEFKSHAKHEYSRALIAAYDYFHGGHSRAGGRACPAFGSGLYDSDTEYSCASGAKHSCASSTERSCVEGPECPVNETGKEKERHEAGRECIFTACKRGVSEPGALPGRTEE